MFLCGSGISRIGEMGCAKLRPDAVPSGRALCVCVPERRAMSQSFKRLLDKAKANHQKARPPDAILILCDHPEQMHKRIDILIRAGTLTEAQRPRCVYCDAAEFVAMTHDQRVHVWAVNDVADESYRDSYYGPLADDDPVWDTEIGTAEKAKSDSADRL
jgi:hypothetical protein